ncbi:MAG TPA: hypothetical protein VFB45_26060 [Pseudolabrys sp.]|nr:hypothetical protein [Pseudolabrys sp.]
MIRFTLRAAVIAALGLQLAACIDSTGPILSDSRPLLGDKSVKLQLYTLRNGTVREPQTVSFRWNGALYDRVSGSAIGISAFSVHEFEAGDLIVQTVPTNRPRITEYGLLHKLAEGVYQLVAIDEADTDDQTRADYCTKVDKSPCRIETRDQLFAFARATAVRQKNVGALVLRLPDGPDRPERAAPRVSHPQHLPHRPPPRLRRAPGPVPPPGFPR